MKLICGLGNPGKEYENTRHNVGFMVIDNYCQNESFSTHLGGLYIQKRIGEEKVIFLKPQSYMNLSGTVVRKYADYFKIDYEDILVVRDDLDLELGRARIKFDSSSGGDNGIKSIISSLNSQKFYQYKIGISNDKTRDTKDYVLGKFSKDERSTIDRVVAGSKDIIDKFILGGITSTIDFNYEVDR